MVVVGRNHKYALD